MLRKAVLEEQSRATNLREQLRRKESTLRRTEQELDSLTFRNKQLELRVAALQDELAIIEGRKQDNKVKDNNFVGISPFRLNTKHSTTTIENDKIIEPPIIEELQKKILENAQLTSLVSFNFVYFVWFFNISFIFVTQKFILLLIVDGRERQRTFDVCGTC